MSAIHFTSAEISIVTVVAKEVILKVLTTQNALRFLLKFLLRFLNILAHRVIIPLKISRVNH